MTQRMVPPTQIIPPEPPMPASMGKEFGNYRIVSLLGSGGMGTVFLAKHKHLGVNRALKLIRPSLAQHRDAVARFQREMLATASLEHANIVRALDAGECGGVYYLAMEFGDGPDVRRLVRNHERLTPSDASELVRQASLGLEEIRRQGLVHRDIKSSNMLVTRDGVLKLLDLGLARSLAGLADEEQTGITIGGAVLGTADYMAPEQADNSTDVDIRADIYSLGCAYYEMLFGRPPFDRPEFDSWSRKVIAHASQSIEVDESVRHNVPDAVLAVLLRMLEKSPAQRFQTPLEVVDALQDQCKNADLAKLVANQPSWTAELSELPEESWSAGSWTPSILTEQTTRKLAPNTPEVTRERPPLVASRFSSSPIWLVTGGVFTLLLVGGLMAAGVWSPWRNDADSAKSGKHGTEAPIAALNEGVPESQIPAIETGADSSDTAKPPPTTSIPDLNNAEANLWHPLFTQPPQRLIWDDKSGRSHWEFHPEQRQLFVAARSESAFAVGTIKSASYDVKLSIHQDEWTTGAGLFWGYKPDPYEGSGFTPGEEPAVHTLYQYVRFSDTDNGIHGFELTRGHVLVIHHPNGEVYTRDSPLAHGVLPHGVRGELIVKIEIREHRLANVLVEDKPIPALTTEKVSTRLQPEDFDGAFGCYCYGAVANFRNANCKRID